MGDLCHALLEPRFIMSAPTIVTQEATHIHGGCRLEPQRGGGDRVKFFIFVEKGDMV